MLSGGRGSTVDALRLYEVCRSRENGMLGELPANRRRCWPPIWAQPLSNEKTKTHAQKALFGTSRRVISLCSACDRLKEHWVSLL